MRIHVAMIIYDNEVNSFLLEYSLFEKGPKTFCAEGGLFEVCTFVLNHLHCLNISKDPLKTGLVSMPCGSHKLSSYTSLVF